MTELLTVPATFICKVRGRDFPIEPRRFPEAVAERIFQYGLQRYFNDTAGGAESVDEAVSLAAKKYEAALAGLLRQPTEREGDPIKAEAMKIARGLVEPALAAKLGVKRAKLDPKLVTQLAKALVESNPSILATATANVNAVRSLGELTLDLPEPKPDDEPTE